MTSRSIRDVLADQGLAVVPQAAAELLEHAVRDREELAQARADLRAFARAQGDGSMADMLSVLRHRNTLIEGRYQAAETALRALEDHWGEAKPQIDAWKRATNQHVRST